MHLTLGLAPLRATRSRPTVVAAHIVQAVSSRTITRHRPTQASASATVQHGRVLARGWHNTAPRTANATTEAVLSDAARWPVPAHGPTGQLVDLMIHDSNELAAARRAAGSSPSLTLSKRHLCDLELLLHGGFSPLDGFMDRRTYDSVVDTCRLPDGTLFPMPITLDISEALQATLAAAGPNPTLTLKDEEGNPLALLEVREMWRPDLAREAREVFGGDAEHPSVVYLSRHTGPFYVSGRLRGLQSPVHYDHADLRRTPREVRAEFVRAGWKKVVAFQTRNPVHRAHFELTVRAARDNDAALLLHPVVGQTKPGDIDHHVRVKCYRSIMGRYAPGTALLSALPLAMRMGGPREAVWHALIRQNYGCTHFILGRDHAGPGSNSAGVPFYGPFAARDFALSHQADLAIRLCPFDMMVYLPDEGRYVGEREVPAGTRTEQLSGTEVRRRLENGSDIPEWFSFPETVDILRSAHPPRARQGVCVFFTGLSGSGKSTIANALVERLLSIDRRTVELLDGDLVRQMLSSELGFSEAHRNLNIQRIGYVASLLVRAGGTVVAAPIAPYARTRDAARAACRPHGAFLEVFVDAPLATCESRDRKGLYARARAGTLKHFTGIDDPYEVPLKPDLRIESDKTTVADAVEAIVQRLVKDGYIAHA